MLSNPNRKNPNQITFTCKLPKTTKQRLDNYCQERGFKKQFIMEKALTDFLDSVEPGFVGKAYFLGTPFEP